MVSVLKKNEIPRSDSDAAEERSDESKRDRFPEEQRSGPEDFSGMFQMYSMFTTARKPDEDGFR